MEVITDGRYRLIGFGGGVRGTKTWGSLSVLITLARVFPGSRWFVVRKDLERIKKSTLPSFEKLRQLTNGFVLPVNRAEFTADCRNGSLIAFVGENIDRDPELQRFHGFEANGFLNDEADELSERTFVKEIERAGTWMVPAGEQPPPLVLNTFNPCSSWPRRRFYTPWRDGQIKPPYAFIPSTQADNPFISDEQREAWKEMPDGEYRRFVMGDWDALQGAYYDTLNPEVHLIDREQLPDALPDYWRYWGSFDWGYGHWSVMGAWATDTDGVDYLLDSVWLRKMQDNELAQEFGKTLPAACLRQVYAGHDCWAKVKAHAASGESVADVFARESIGLVKADIDPVNGGRAVNRQLKESRVRILRTPGNLRIFDQLGEIVPDPNDIRRPLKVDCDANGSGGDDGADMFRYGIATRIAAARAPKQPHVKLPDRAEPLHIEDGKLVQPKRAPKTVEELVAWAAERRAGRGTLPHRERLPRRTYR